MRVHFKAHARVAGWFALTVWRDDHASTWLFDGKPSPAEFRRVLGILMEKIMRIHK